MKRKYIYDLIIIGLLGLAFLYFQYYTPRSVIRLHEKINQTTAGEYNQERLALSKDYEAALAWGLPRGDTTPSIGHYFIGKQRKLLDLRIKQAINEIKSEAVPNGQVKIWSMLNMGAVLKTSDSIIAIDTANIAIVSKAHDELASLADIFIVTHADSDHYDRELLIKALQQNKKLVFLDGFYFNNETNNPNIYKLASGQKTKINNIYITAFKTDHRGDGNFEVPSAWYLIEIGDIKILHTGDGLAFYNPDESQKLKDRKDIDIMLANVMLSPENIQDISPKIIVPLHLFKYLHSREALADSTFEQALAKYDIPALSSINKKLLFAGESLNFSQSPAKMSL